MSTLLKKMSIKALGCDAKEAREKRFAPTTTTIPDPSDPTKTVPNPDAGRKIPLAVIYGKASGLKIGEDNRTGDPWSALKGEFEGVCMQVGQGYPTGEVFTSGVLFLPPGIHEAVEGVVENNPGDTVEFAMEISAGWDPSTVGFRYYGRNLKPASAADSLSHIRALVQPTVPGVNLGPAPVLKIEAPPQPPVTEIAPPTPPAAEAAKAQTAPAKKK